jgi:hypothetical protein
MDADSTPTLTWQNIANGCAGTGSGLSKMIWTCQKSGTYYLEAAADDAGFWGKLTSQIARLNYQTIPSSSVTCSDIFYDKGTDGTDGATASYNNNDNWVYTYYPVDPVADAINVQFVSFSTSPGDILCVYNGNSINAPLIGCYSGPSITGAFSSSAHDGSLTFQFTSDDSLISAGWEANVSCVASLRVRDNSSAMMTGIHPNPVDAQFTVEGLLPGIENTIHLFNIVGKKIKSQTTNEAKIVMDATALAPGIYFIRVENGITKWNGKFIKQ